MVRPCNSKGFASFCVLVGRWYNKKDVVRCYYAGQVISSYIRMEMMENKDRLHREGKGANATQRFSEKGKITSPWVLLYV